MVDFRCNELCYYQYGRFSHCSVFGKSVEISSERYRLPASAAQSPTKLRRPSRSENRARCLSLNISIAWQCFIIFQVSNTATSIAAMPMAKDHQTPGHRCQPCQPCQQPAKPHQRGRCRFGEAQKRGQPIKDNMYQ